MAASAAPAEVQGQLAVALDPDQFRSLPAPDWRCLLLSTAGNTELARWTRCDILSDGRCLLVMPLDEWSKVSSSTGMHLLPLYAFTAPLIHTASVKEALEASTGEEVRVPLSFGAERKMWLSDSAEVPGLKRVDLAGLLLQERGHVPAFRRTVYEALDIAGVPAFLPPPRAQPSDLSVSAPCSTSPPYWPTAAAAGAGTGAVPKLMGSAQHCPIRITVLHDGENLQVPTWLASRFHPFMVQVLASLVAKWLPQHCARDVAMFSEYATVQWKYVTSTPVPEKHSSGPGAYPAARGVVDMMAKTLGVTCIDSGAKAGSADTAIRNEMVVYKDMNAGAMYADGSRLLLVVASSDADFNTAIHSVMAAQLEVAVIAGRRYRTGMRGMRGVEHVAWEDWVQNFQASGYTDIFGPSDSLPAAASRPARAEHHGVHARLPPHPASMPQARLHSQAMTHGRVPLGSGDGPVSAATPRDRAAQHVRGDNVLLAKFDKPAKLAAKYLNACIEAALAEMLAYLLGMEQPTVARLISVHANRQLTTVEVLVHQDLCANSSQLDLCRAVVKDIYKSLQTDTARELKLEPWAFFHSDLTKELRRWVYAQLNCSREQAPLSDGRPYSALFATCVAEPGEARRLVEQAFLRICGDVLHALEDCPGTPGLMIVRLNPHMPANRFKPQFTKLVADTQTLDTAVAFHHYSSYAQSWLRLKRFEAPPATSVGLACPKLPLASAPDVTVDKQAMRQDIAALLATVRGECEFVSTGFNYHNAAHRELLQRQLAAGRPSPYVRMEIDGPRVALRGVNKHVDAAKSKLTAEFDMLVPLSETLAGLASALQYPAFCVLRDKIADIAQSDGGEKFACVLQSAAPARVAAGAVLRENIADAAFRPDWPADRECALSKIVAVCAEDEPGSGASRHISALLQTVQALASAATATVPLPDSTRAAWQSDPAAQAKRMTASFRLLFAQAVEDAAQVQLVGEQASVRHAADLIQRGEDMPAAAAGAAAELRSVRVTLPAAGLFHVLQTQPSLMEQLTSRVPPGATVALADGEHFQLAISGPFGVVGAAQEVVCGALDEMMEAFTVDRIELHEEEVEVLKDLNLVADMQLPGKEGQARATLLSSSQLATLANRHASDHSSRAWQYQVPGAAQAFALRLSATDFSGVTADALCYSQHRGMRYGIAESISRAAEAGLAAEVKRIFQETQALQPGQCLATESYGLPGYDSCILHAFPGNFGELTGAATNLAVRAIRLKQASAKLCDTISRVCQEAANHECTSLALPLLGVEENGWPVELVAQQLLASVLQWWDDHPGTCLTSITVYDSELARMECMAQQLKSTAATGDLTLDAEQPDQAIWKVLRDWSWVELSLDASEFITAQRASWSSEDEGPGIPLEGGQAGEMLHFKRSLRKPHDPKLHIQDPAGNKLPLDMDLVNLRQQRVPAAAPVGGMLRAGGRSSELHWSAGSAPATPGSGTGAEEKGAIELLATPECFGQLKEFAESALETL